MAATHPVALIELVPGLPEMSTSRPSRNEDETIETPSMATPTSTTKRRESSSPRGSTTFRDSPPGTQSHAVPEISDAEYQLQPVQGIPFGHTTGAREMTKQSVPRSMPEPSRLEQLDVFEDRPRPSNTSLVVRTVLETVDSTMLSSSENSQPYTPESPSTFGVITNTRGVGHSIVSNTALENVEHPSFSTIGPITNVAPASLEPSDKPDNHLSYDPNSDNESYEENGDDRTNEDQECAECRAAEDVNKLESNVRQIAGHDLALAAYLIPLLHLMAHREHVGSGEPKGMPTTQCAGESGENAAGAFVPGDRPSSDRGDRKRSANDTGSGQDGGEQQRDEDEDEQEGNNRTSKKLKSSEYKIIERLACPFNKWNPQKYNIHYDKNHSGKAEFQVCHGPGLSDVPRLKTHLKEVHTFVQCQCCSKVFKGKRKKRIKDLEQHRLQNCQINPSIVSEGITETKWDEIESIPKPRKSRPETNVEKWYKIWDILFPEVQRPDNPWCKESHVATAGPTIEKAVPGFSDCYNITLGKRDEYTAYVGDVITEALCRETFQLWYAKFMTSSSNPSLAKESPSSRTAFRTPFLGVGSNEYLTAVGAQRLDRETAPQVASSSHPLHDRRAFSSPVVPSAQSGSDMGAIIEGNHGEHTRDRISSLPASFQNDHSSTAYMATNFSQISTPTSNPSYADRSQSNNTYDRNPIRSPDIFSQPANSHYGFGNRQPSNTNTITNLSEPQTEQVSCFDTVFANSERCPLYDNPSQSHNIADHVYNHQQFPGSFALGNFGPPQGGASHANVGLQPGYTNQWIQTPYSHKENDYKGTQNEDSLGPSNETWGQISGQDQ